MLDSQNAGGTNCPFVGVDANHNGAPTWQLRRLIPIYRCD